MNNGPELIPTPWDYEFHKSEHLWNSWRRPKTSYISNARGSPIIVANDPDSSTLAVIDQCLVTFPPSWRMQLLDLSEIFWRDQYDWLLKSGYKLRPRYHPNWAPSWPNKTDGLKRLSAGGGHW